MCGYSPWNILLSHFCVRSPFTHRPFTVRSSCIHRSQSVHHSLTKRSPIVHKAFIVHLAFSLQCHSELWSWKINITILERSYDKEVGLCFILKTWVFLSNKTTKNSQNLVKLEPEVKWFVIELVKLALNSYRRNRTIYIYNSMCYMYLLTKFVWLYETY